MFQNKIKVIIGSLVLFAIIGTFSACFSPYKGETGTININLGGNARAVGMPYPPTDINDVLIDLELRIQLQGPTGTQNHTLEKGVSSAFFTVAPGLWHVTVNAYHNAIEHYATGTGSVDVKAGQNNSVTILMEHIHLWAANGTPTVAPTCTATGIGPVLCTPCGKTEASGVVPALGHDYGGWTVTITSTCIAAGVETGICNNDPTHTNTRPIPVLPHTRVPATGICPVTGCGALTYNLGDTGPGGGKIFYVADGLSGRTLGFTLYQTAIDTVGSTAYYLEAATTNKSSSTWATSPFTQDIAGTGTEIGTGRKNTALILGTDTGAPAASACNTHNEGGQTDWFLPSQDELLQLWLNRVSANFTTTGFFWSSSQNDTGTARAYQFFLDGTYTPANSGKDNLTFSRPIRAF